MLLRRLRCAALSLLICVPLFAQGAPSGYYYTVRGGDSLSLVARRHSISAASLAQANRVAPTARLVAGTRLWVPAPPPNQADASLRRVPAASASTRRPVIDTSVASRPAPPPPRGESSAPAARAPAPSPAGIYVVQPGDTLWGLSRRFQVSVADLAAWNGMKASETLEVGRKLKVSPDALEEIPGGGLRDRPGPPPAVSAPAPAQPPASSNTAGSAPPRPSSRGYIWPAEGRLLRRFVNSSSEKFMGMNIELPVGTEIRAANSGRVVYAGNGIPAYGSLVIIEHDGDVATCYSHLGRILVREDQTVRRGQAIGRSGTTPRGEALLHFELRVDGDAVDPERWLP